MATEGAAVATLIKCVDGLLKHHRVAPAIHPESLWMLAPESRASLFPLLPQFADKTMTTTYELGMYVYEPLLMAMTALLRTNS